MAPPTKALGTSAAAYRESDTEHVPVTSEISGDVLCELPHLPPTLLLLIMGRPSWANKEQTAWLWSRHAEFLEGRATRAAARTKAAGRSEQEDNPFFSKTCQAFFDEFGKPPPPAEGEAVVGEDGKPVDPVQIRRNVSRIDYT